MPKWGKALGEDVFLYEQLATQQGPSPSWKPSSIDGEYFIQKIRVAEPFALTSFRPLDAAAEAANVPATGMSSP